MCPTIWERWFVPHNKGTTVLTAMTVEQIVSDNLLLIFKVLAMKRLFCNYQSSIILASNHVFFTCFVIGESKKEEVGLKQKKGPTHCRFKLTPMCDKSKHKHGCYFALIKCKHGKNNIERAQIYVQNYLIWKSP